MPHSADALVGRRILVVENDYLLAMEVKRRLQAAGSDVIGPVPSVDQALDLIEDDSPDAAVLDVNLGDGTMVFPVADRLDALGVPYLFATGAVEEVKRRGYGSRPLLQKPSQEADLLRMMSELFECS